MGTLLEWSGTRFYTVKFDAAKRYLRTRSGGTLAVSAGRTWTIAPNNSPTPSSQPWHAFRFSMASAADSFTQTSVSVSGGDSATDNTPPAVSPVIITASIG